MRYDYKASVKNDFRFLHSSFFVFKIGKIKEKNMSLMESRKTADILYLLQKQTKEKRKEVEKLEKLSKKSIISYGFGDMASQLVWQFVGTYLTVYYMDIVGLAPMAVSTIMMIAKIWDGINDPMMGGIAERTRSKWGRFRPYILFGAPFLALFSVLTFTSPFGNGTAGVVWATFTYIGAGMLYTLVNIPYGALGGVMTTHDSDRNALNSIRGIGMQVGMLIINFGSPILLMALAGSDTITKGSYMIAAIIFAIISLPMFYIVFRNSQEVIMPKVNQEKVSIIKNLKIILTNKYLMIIVLTMFFQMAGNMGRISVMSFYVTHCLGNFALMSLLMTLPSLGSIVGNIIAPFLIKHLGKHGKRNVLVASLLGKGIALLWIFLIPYEDITMLIVAHVVFAIAGFGFPSTLSMVTDAVDYQDLRTNVRSDGVAYAFYGLATKVGNALGSAVGVMLMAAFGYVSGAEITASAQQGINMATNLVPGICFVVSGLIPLILWRMTDREADEIREKLVVRNQTEIEEVK